MRIAMDLDGCVVDFVGAVQDAHEAEFGWRPEILVWDFTPHTALRTWDRFWAWADTKGLYDVAQPYPGAVEAVQELVDAGYYVSALTTRPAWAAASTLRWLRAYGLRVPCTMLSDKMMLDFDLYVDDAPAVLDALRAARPNRRIIRVVRPWNHPLPGVADVASVAEVPTLLEGDLL